MVPVSNTHPRHIDNTWHIIEEQKERKNSLQNKHTNQPCHVEFSKGISLRFILIVMINIEE